MRGRFAVTRAVLAAFVGDWLSHGLNYWRVAGRAGLHARLMGGIHDYMLPVGLALLVGAAFGAAVWTRAWLSLGRRLGRSAAGLSRRRRGEPLGRRVLEIARPVRASPGVASAPSVAKP